MDTTTQTLIAVLLIFIVEAAVAAWLGAWASRGGRGRVLVGLFLTFWIGALLFWPIFAFGFFRARRRTEAAR